MFAATAPEGDVEEDYETGEKGESLQQVEAQKDAEGQPSASSAAAGTASSEFSSLFYDVFLMDYIHETMAGDNQRLLKVAADILTSIKHEDNALSLN